MNKKSRIFYFVTVILILAAYLFGVYQGMNYDPSNIYTAPAMVSEVDEVTGWITFVDWDGEAWCIRDTGYEVGQLVILEFNDNATEDNIYDDSIVNVESFTNIEEVE